ncbi:hypothetical protein ALO61_102721 [Pseudomonas savastanoi pv. nerii]|uniref:Uncharacterized protein n=3 Tax=Pseudomonas savastanoi TaxID=29438 RepID=A0A0Q0AET4_PSESS|nr:hypothetical protein ALO61_102721 [Pseudomonas savastanoi pv. nerii]KPY29863.1 hypothetical protein ALO49_102831 [Pseudomonas savastanoi pv. retacarpa]KPY68014.1 hypothetical protein ALO58_102797 [Pseudomonas savastanoi pv. savastanoi]KUG40669.1 hypothetical protein ALP79_102840 [Pseudomonas savastanoi pv. fraxini]RML16540.1 hypothetical protein ALR00_103142 [Pseudomonas savastanoi pv. retacarpa]
MQNPSILPFTLKIELFFSGEICYLDHGLGAISMNSGLYTIDYVLHGEARSFVIRADKMGNAEAWHWASCDAGFGHIPRSNRDQTRRTSKPRAEQFGITDVRWRSADSLAS